MSFSMVMTDVVCAACDARHRDGVRFQTGDDSDMPWYERGSRVPLPPGSVYDGSCDAYCSACLRRWRADDHAVQLDTFADLLESGAITAFAGTYRAEPPDWERVLRIHRDAPITAAQMRARGRVAPPPHARMNLDQHLGDVVLYRAGELTHLSPTENMAHVVRVQERLVELGWTFVEGVRSMRVTVDATGLIDVG